MISQTILKIPRKRELSGQHPDSDSDSDKAPSLPGKRPGSAFGMGELNKSLPDITSPISPHRSFHQWSSKFMESTKNTWLKHAKKILNKEHKDSKTLQISADFHGAIRKAFDYSQINTNDYEIRSIKITPGANLHDNETLSTIWHKALHLHSTKLPQESSDRSPPQPTNLEGPDSLHITRDHRQTVHGSPTQTGRTHHTFHGLVLWYKMV